jgi:hypothetical protein
MSELVNKLRKGNHAVSLIRYSSKDELSKAVERGFILAKFTETEGGTEVGFSIDDDKSKIDIEGNPENLTMVGQFTLDSISVQCEIKINADSLKGTGKLKVLENK